MEESISLIGLAFCGGAMGAAFGAMPSFVLFGLLVAFGSIITLTTGDDFFLQQIAFGNIFGPHVAFAGGVAAAAFAAKKKYFKGTGKDISESLLLLKNSEPLLVGGIFGVVGLLVRALFEDVIPLTYDAIAVSIFLTALLCRMLFSRKGMLRCQPFRLCIGKEDKKHGIWLPFQSDILGLILLGAVFGLISANVTVIFGDPYLIFGISCLSLVFALSGKAVPITHHIVLPAALAMTVTENLFLGVFFGVIGALLAELGARLFYNEGDTHIDPPSFSLMFTSLLVFLVGATLV